MSKVLLLGGGNVLSLLARQMKQANQDFVITSRSASKVQQFEALGYSARQVDIADLKSVKECFRDQSEFKVVIDSVPPIFSANLDPLIGVKNVSQVLNAYPLEHFIYLSTSGVYGGADGEVVTEQSPTKPSSVRAQARLDSEQFYSNLKSSVTSLRIVGICSDQSNPLRSLIAGTYPLIDHGNRYSNRIHIEDLVQILHRSLTMLEKLPKTINISDGQPTKVSDLIKQLRQRYNFSLPASITYQEAEQRGWHTLLNNQQVSNQLLLAIFGDIIRYSGSEWMQAGLDSNSSVFRR